jgi:hypothetical protein
MIFRGNGTRQLGSAPEYGTELRLCGSTDKYHSLIELVAAIEFMWGEIGGCGCVGTVVSCSLIAFGFSALSTVFVQLPEPSVSGTLKRCPGLLGSISYNPIVEKQSSHSARETFWVTYIVSGIRSYAHAAAESTVDGVTTSGICYQVQKQPDFLSLASGNSIDHH